MKMFMEGTFLRSAVARRVFFLFLLSAFVPATLLALLSYGHVRAVVSDYAQRQLVQAGSGHARALYDRLLGAHFILNANAAQIRANQEVADADPFALQRVFRRSYLVRPERSTLRFGTPSGAEPPRIDARAAVQLAKGEVALLLAQPGSTAGRAWLAVAVDPAQVAGGVLIAELQPAYLWGDSEEISYQTDICVLTEGAVVLYCSSGKVSSTATSVALRRADVPADSADGWLSATSGLFLKAKFGADDWNIVALRPGGLAIASLTRLAQTYLGVTLLTLLLVALLSVVQIRRTLVPLERLIEGTERISREDFEQPIKVERDDEFGQLARSLNGMALRVGQQIGALRALSQIDQEILSHLHIGQIVVLVQARLLALLPKAVIGVVLLDERSADLGTAYLQRVTDAQPTKVPLQLDPQKLANCVHYRDGAWLPVDGPDVPRFVAMLVGLGAAHCFVIPIFWRDEICGALGMGVADQQELNPELIEQARDLAKRVGVGFAALAREAELVLRAHHDDLTGLPNRALLSERLQQELARARRTGKQLALLFLDLDRFKSVNDTLGHDGGDQLLRVAAERLSACVRECDTVARLGGDEFVVLLTGLDNPQQAAKLAGQVLALLSEPFQVAGSKCFIGASIGVSVFPADGSSAEELLKQADIAMYRAKAAGRGRFVFFEESMNVEQRERAVMEQELHLAIIRNQFAVHYQPRVDLRDGRLLGAEALLRWNHPLLGSVSPAIFIPLAEDAGLIESIGPWVLRQVCAQLAAWQAAGYAVGTVAVNVSGRQFRSDDLVAQVTHALESTGLAPHVLELEVTEGVLIDDVESVIDVLGRLKQIGVSVALDDFGTGYSSMAYLRRLPIDVLKIDQSFVRDLAHDEDARNIVQAIIAMAHALHKSVVAEGVETLVQANLLRSWGCNQAQGFYFSRAVTAAALEALMEKTLVLSDDTIAMARI
ncbi:EAL domain-containing protein [Rhodoferax sp.]|uniref:putative bifunctional diguanylate cyclase/phosphodiesterase n=1 Tax=Rhodoferax sp. TaxID=50421 RepID=UPI0025D8CCA0|nr:EAL domain-containing protein [Rhodoferax sp.]MBU3998423.1 EAL domain-containing protein [Gammaproteobacteria bacterium]MBU4171752.1 EAL domain-containing protein [Gammaproteobacteria bacterium]